MMSVLISLLLTLRTWARSRAALQLEVLALRHQLQVLQRSKPRRVRLAKADRALGPASARTGWRGERGGRGSTAILTRHRRRQRRPPSQTWRTFLRNHIGQIVAADFFVRCDRSSWCSSLTIGDASAVRSRARWTTDGARPDIRRAAPRPHERRTDCPARPAAATTRQRQPSDPQ